MTGGTTEGSARPRAEAKRPPGGAAGRCPVRKRTGEKWPERGAS